MCGRVELDAEVDGLLCVLEHENDGSCGGLGMENLWDTQYGV